MTSLHVFFLLSLIVRVMWCRYDFCSDVCRPELIETLTCKCSWASNCAFFEHENINMAWKQFRQAFLDAHNKYRNQFALSETLIEKSFGFKGAANMVALSYDYDLEFTARCHTKRCVYDKHCVITDKYKEGGQNLYVFPALPSLDPKSIADTVLDSWYMGDILHFNPTVAALLKDPYEPSRLGLTESITSFTQIVWAETRVIGCWASHGTITQYVDRSKKTDTKPMALPAKMLVTCAYGPGGNIKGQHMYKEGNSTSNCPDKLTPNAKYKGLCGDDIIPPEPYPNKIYGYDDHEVDPSEEFVSNSPPTTRGSLRICQVLLIVALIKIVMDSNP